MENKEVFLVFICAWDFILSQKLSEKKRDVA